MDIYELINPSDLITFESDDPIIAKVCGLVVGQGLYGVEKITNKESEELMLPYMTFPDDKQQIELLGKTLNDVIAKRKDEVIACFKTFAVCPVNMRKHYKEHTKNYTDTVLMSEWDEEHKSSSANICMFAHSIRGTKKDGS